MALWSTSCMKITSKTCTHVLAAGAALLLVAGCSSSDSDSDAASDAATSASAAPTEPAATEPAPTEPAPTEPTTTSSPASGTDCDAATLAAALDTSEDKIERFECEDGYAGVDYAMGSEGIEGTVILSSDDGSWSKVNKSVCTDDDFPSSLKKNYCDVS